MLALAGDWGENRSREERWGGDGPTAEGDLQPLSQVTTVVISSTQFQDKLSKENFFRRIVSLESEKFDLERDVQVGRCEIILSWPSTNNNSIFPTQPILELQLSAIWRWRTSTSMSWTSQWTTWKESKCCQVVKQRQELFMLYHHVSTTLSISIVVKCNWKTGKAHATHTGNKQTNETVITRWSVPRPQTSLLLKLRTGGAL